MYGIFSYPMKKTKSHPTTIARLRAYAWSSAAVFALVAGLSVAVVDSDTAAPAPWVSPLAPHLAPGGYAGEVVSAAGSVQSIPLCVPVAQAEIVKTPAIVPRPRMRLSDEEIRTLVARYTERYSIPELAGPMARVIHAESRGFEAVRSPNGRYVGLCQFMPRTFRANVAAMKRAGLLDPDEGLSPLDPEDAVNVMAWMWSQGYSDQWGPARYMDFAQFRADTHH